jgi:hypothetical protein
MGVGFDRIVVVATCPGRQDEGCKDNSDQPVYSAVSHIILPVYFNYNLRSI